MHLQIGDVVNCKIYKEIVVDINSDYDFIKSFEVVQVDDSNCYLYVPQFSYVKDTFVIDSWSANQLNIDDKFIDEQILLIKKSWIVSIKQKIDGAFCKKCKEFFHQANSNMPDNSFLCFLCRTYPYR